VTDALVSGIISWGEREIRRILCALFSLPFSNFVLFFHFPISYDFLIFI
jgi:hypothetical protein